MEQPDKKQQAIDSISHLSKGEQAKILLYTMFLSKVLKRPLSVDEAMRFKKVKESEQRLIKRRFE